MKQLELDNNLNSGNMFDDRYYHEVTINGSEQQKNQHLLETLQQYSREDRSGWITCILPEKIHRQLLESENIPAAGVLQLVAQENLEIEKLAIKALLSGQSHGVLLMIRRLQGAQREKLRDASNSTEVYCTVITSY